jgi:hypothetical protein
MTTEVKYFYSLAGRLQSIKQKGVPSRHSSFTKKRLMLRLRLRSLYSACTPKRFVGKPRASHLQMLQRIKIKIALQILHCVYSIIAATVRKARQRKSAFFSPDGQEKSGRSYSATEGQSVYKLSIAF